ncbi:hypothetical protein Mmar10_2480 [Maricaulis maris MCS10]|jgi:hypothetical protein|uniref:Uncharacterized protein n=1 Tax=Maricaulis maris (strain MCS10) TaxID=394221 RepID=Q0ALS5_MARMM|nr:hypothetical protein Mmar10_2480 [Maricaulis maris MCS10]
MTYFPPSNGAVSKQLRTVLATKLDRVEVPTDLVRYLFILCATSAEFDEDEYVQRNPDVGDAISRGRVASALDHFLRQGFQEGRDYSLKCQEQEYLSHNPDIAAAFESGDIVNVSAHFHETGYAEGRVGSHAQMRAARYIRGAE